MSYPYLFTQAKYNGENVGYKVDALIAKSTDMADLKKAMNAAKIEAFGSDQKLWPKVITCIKDGDTKEDQENYKDHFYVTLKSKERRPMVVDKNKKEVDNESEVYGGRWARAAAKFMVVKSGEDYYMACYMNAVQLLEKAPAFGGGSVDLDAAFGGTVSDESDDSCDVMFKKPRLGSPDDDESSLFLSYELNSSELKPFRKAIFKSDKLFPAITLISAEM